MKEWHEFLAKLETELGPEIVQKWVPKLIRFDAANIYLEAVDSFQMIWFEEHVRPKLKGFFNSNHRPIKVHFLEKKKEVIAQEETIQFYPGKIDAEMSFDTFVPANENLVAYKLLQEMASFNPIYLYGPKNCGKTHLLMAAANILQEQKKKVIFVRAETFTDHVVQAIRLGQMQKFRRFYREIDALFIDDIHIFSKKSATQEEFFHTFNTLHTTGKQIVITSTFAPSKLKEIEPRLISRFEWGISLEMGKSDLVSILKKKALIWKVDLPEKIQNWLIEKFPNDPVLAFHTLLLRAKTTHLHIEVAEKILKDLLEKLSENGPTFEKIIKIVASHYGITSADILGKSQMREIALPRQIAMYFCRVQLQLPYQKIGELFGRDHSTVMSNVKQIQNGVIPPEILGALQS